MKLLLSLPHGVKHFCLLSEVNVSTLFILNLIYFQQSLLEEAGKGETNPRASTHVVPLCTYQAVHSQLTRFEGSHSSGLRSMTMSRDEKWQNDKSSQISRVRVRNDKRTMAITKEDAYPHFPVLYVHLCPKYYPDQDHYNAVVRVVVIQLPHLLLVL